MIFPCFFKFFCCIFLYCFVFCGKSLFFCVVLFCEVLFFVALFCVVLFCEVLFCIFYLHIYSLLYFSFGRVHWKEDLFSSN